MLNIIKPGHILKLKITSSNLLVHAMYSLTRNAGGFLNLESILPLGSGTPKSIASSKGLRYSSSEVIGLLISIGRPRVPFGSCTESVKEKGYQFLFPANKAYN